MEKFEKERLVINYADNVLNELYASYDLIDSQKDKPDAAIKTKNNRIIGIEVTTVDRETDLEHYNDKTFESDLVNTQIERIVTGKPEIERLYKTSKIIMNRKYIFNGAYKKNSLYRKYKKIAEFDEVILICFSDFMSGLNKEEYEVLCNWAEYLLSRERFEFDKVIFVCSSNKKAKAIYDKTSKVTKVPSHKNIIVEVELPHFLPISTNRTYNLASIEKDEPIVRPKSDNKKQRKAQKKEVDDLIKS